MYDNSSDCDVLDVGEDNHMVAPEVTKDSKPFQKGADQDHLDAALAVKAVELNGLLTNKLL